MPTLIFLAVAYQIQNIKWRYLFLALTALSFIYNLYFGMWVQEIYSVVIAILLFMLTPYFSCWWQKRNARNNPTSLLAFSKETWLLAKFNKFKLFFWILFLVVSITSVSFYTGYTDQILLGSLLAAFLLIYGFKHLFALILPPEWFLHDINTGYVFLSVLIAYWLSDLISQKLSLHFILPMILAGTFCLVAFFLVRKNSRYIIPGCAIVLADLIWQLVRLTQDDLVYSHSLILTVIILVLTMLIGIIWLIKKPGVMPIVYLALFQLFRFSTFSYEATDHAMTNALSISEATDYVLYLVCWMYIAPLLFWMIGLKQITSNANPNEEHRPVRVNKLFEQLKKGLNH